MPFNITKTQAAVMQALADPPRRRKKTNAAKKRALKQKTSVAPVTPVNHGHFKLLKERASRTYSRYDATTKMYRKKTLELSIKMLAKLRSDLTLTGPEGDRVKTIAFLENRIARLKASRAVVKPKQRKKTAKVKAKVNRTEAAVMDLNPRNHKTKVYISPEQRAINKAKDGAVTRHKSMPAKASGIRLVGSTKPFVNSVKKNSPPKFTRKEKLQLQYWLNKKPKHSPYQRMSEEVVSKAA